MKTFLLRHITISALTFAMMTLLGCGNGTSSGSSSISYSSNPTPPSNITPAPPVISPSSPPTFTGSFTSSGNTYFYTMAGGLPQKGGTTTISTAIIPVSLVFDEFVDTGGNKMELDAGSAIPSVIASPIFQNYAFSTGTTQYGDAVQRAAFWGVMQHDWHTILSQPALLPAIKIEVPAGHAFLLRKSNSADPFPVVDLALVEKAITASLAQAGAVNPVTLPVIIVRNAAFYGAPDPQAATVGPSDPQVCCSFGEHKAFSLYGITRSFVLASYIDPGLLPENPLGQTGQGMGPLTAASDVQPISEQIAEWLRDPNFGYQGNVVPYWRSPVSSLGCPSDNGAKRSPLGGTMSDAFVSADPTHLLLSPQASVSVSLGGGSYHLQNAALLSWYEQNGSSMGFEGAFSYPGTQALSGPAQPCAFEYASGGPSPSVSPSNSRANGHLLVGYWEANQAQTNGFVRLKDLSPQFDMVIVQGASVVTGSTSQLQFTPPPGEAASDIQDDIASLHGTGRKVLISLGGPQVPVQLKTSSDVQNFVTSAVSIVQQYGFDGIEINGGNVSLALDSGDISLQNPTTATIVNLISAIQQLKTQLGQTIIVETAATPQIQGGYNAYSSTNGSFLPVLYATRSIASFVQGLDFNTAPLEALDGNFYVPGTADYQVAMADMLLSGFPAGGDLFNFFPPVPPQKLILGGACCASAARGFTSLEGVANAWNYLTEGTSFGGQYTLQSSINYPNLNGIVAWSAAQDRWNNYQFSNTIGPLLHNMPILQTNTCSYSLSSLTGDVQAAGGTATVSVTSGSSCNWTARKLTPNADWLSLTSGVLGSGTGTVTLTASANSGAARSAVLLVADSLFTVHQDAGAPPTLLLTDRTRVPHVDAKDIVFDPTRQVLYASVSGRSTYQPNTIAVIEPSAGQVLAWIPTDQFPNRVALSDDGHYLYVGLEQGSLIDRLDLNTDQIDLRIDLWKAFGSYDSDPADCGISAGEIAVIPGQPHSIAVSAFGCSNPVPLGIFDDGAIRAKLGPVSNASLSFSSPNTLWTSDAELTVDSTGVISQKNFTYLDLRAPTGSAQFTLASGDRVFTGAGDVININPLSLQAKLLTAFVVGGLAYRPANDRVYLSGFTGGWENLGIQEYDPNTSRLTGMFYISQPSADFTVCPASSGKLVATGSIGFAMTGGPVGVSHYGDGAPVCLYPETLIQPARYSLPPPQPANGSIRRFTLPITSAVASAHGDVFYLATSAAAADIGNAILPFDPNAGSFGTPVFVGSDPDLLTLSGTGNSLFAELYGEHSIVKLSLPDLKPVYQFPMLNRTGNWTSAVQIQPLPGSDDSLVVSQLNDGSPWELVAIYDSGIKRDRTTYDFIYDPPGSSCLVSSFQVSDDGNSLWGMDTYTTPSCISKWQISSSGLSQPTPGNSFSTFQGMIVCEAGFCFTESGSVVNASSLQLIGLFGQFGAADMPGSAGRMLPDLAFKRVFYINSQGSLRTFVFDPANPAPSQTPAATHQIPDFFEGLRGFFKWNDELVVVTDSELVMIPISVATSSQ